jgi:pimeloyl-ACP methyl ester carboxylesterase
VVKAAKFLMKGRDWAVIALNFRSHGPSRGDERYLPTFGEAEMWDIQAALEYAEGHRFPKPYVLIGYSMGAMAASRVAQSDARVSAAFLISPPYKARHALRTVSKRKAFRGVHKLIESSLNRTYRSRCKSLDIIGQGDPRRHNMSPLHAPYLCYWIGNRDEYEWKSLYKKLYKKWYGGLHVGGLNELPAKRTDRLAWFVVGDGNHHIGRNGWRQIEPVLERFLSLLMAPRHISLHCMWLTEK